MRGWDCPLAQERVLGCRNEDAPTDVYGQPDKQRDYLLDDQHRKNGFENLSHRFRAARLVCIGSTPMTNPEAIQRLSINTGDCSAVSWLHHNNTEVIHAVVTRYFGTGPVTEKAECELRFPVIRVKR